MLCTSHCGKCCSADDFCVDCYSWTDEKWEKVSAYHEKLAVQQKRKERKMKSSLLFQASHYQCYVCSLVGNAS